MLRAARPKALSTSAPVMISALARPSLAKRARRAAVFGASTVAASSTTRAPSLALDERACFRPRARTFLGRSISWLRTTGPWALAPPTNWAARREPCRAPPVPFCLYIFLPVRETSLRTWILWLPERRLASCQVTTRCRMSPRISAMPKISSDSSIEPALPASRVTTSSFILFFAPGFVGFDGRFDLGRGRSRFGLGLADAARLGSLGRQGLLDRVADLDVR